MKKEWLEKLFTLKQKFNLDVERCATAIYKPEPIKVKRFLTHTNFYDPKDPIILAAGVLKQENKITASQVKLATSAKAKSHHGQGLQPAYEYLYAASEFFPGTISTKTLGKRFQVEKLGLDGKSA